MKSSIKNKNNKKSEKIVQFSEIIFLYFFVDDPNENRKSHWVEDRCHFQRRCHHIQNTISFIFEDSHRQKIKKIITSQQEI